MRRKLLILYSAMSLLLCAAVCVLWVRSYLVLDTVQRYRFSPGKPKGSHRKRECRDHLFLLA